MRSQWLALWKQPADAGFTPGKTDSLLPPKPVRMDLSELPATFLRLAEYSPDSLHALQYLADVTTWTADGWSIQHDDSWNVWLVDAAAGKADVFLSPGLSASFQAAEWTSATRFVLYGATRDGDRFRLTVWNGDLESNTLRERLGPVVEYLGDPPGDWTGWLADRYGWPFHPASKGYPGVPEKAGTSLPSKSDEPRAVDPPSESQRWSGGRHPVIAVDGKVYPPPGMTSVPPAPAWVDTINEPSVITLSIMAGELCPVQAPSFQATVEASRSGSHQSGRGTYAYTVENDSTSQSGIEAFGIHKASGVVEVGSPPNWKVFRGFAGDSTAVVWIAVDAVSRFVAGAQSGNHRAPSEFAIRPGESLTFRVTSSSPATFLPFALHGYGDTPRGKGDEPDRGFFDGGGAGRILGPGG